MDTEFVLKLVVVIGAFAMALYGLRIVHQRLTAKNQGFGSNSLRAFGAVLFLPTLLILAVTTQFQIETLAALLGTVAGYLLSRSGDDGNNAKNSKDSST